MNPHDIIIAPIITERSTLNSYNGKYTFKVASKATKVQIRQACEELFNVKVLKVNTRNVIGKNKRVGLNSGRTPGYKKAIVTIDTDPQAGSYKAKGGEVVNPNKKYNNTIEEFGFGQ
ncbi:MAG: 50S ribosomal protein L23 [Eubacteriales bacterium]|nr:50S ribosomal protein L23 [Eubacteriales bacterium]